MKLREVTGIMKKIRTLLYSIRQGFLGIGRNRMFSLASVGTIMACLFIFGIFYMLITNVHYIIENAETSVGVTVFFEPGLSEEDKEHIGAEIRNRAEVAGVVYTSAEEAWAKYKEEALNPELAETFGDDNPLAESDSYAVYLKDVDRQRALVLFIEGLPGVRKVNSSDSTATSLSSFNSLVSAVSGTLLIVLLAVSVFLINMTITMGISVRKEEIAIMRYVGATDFFIRAPFVVEGLLIGLIGSIIPLGLLYVLYERILKLLGERFNAIATILTFIPAEREFAVLIPLTILLGAGIGLVGSFITVRRHLHY